MRALCLFLLAPLLGCQAIVGSYEIGESDSGARDTAVADTSTTDTQVVDSAVADTAITDATDAGFVVTSCKAHKAKGSSPTTGAPGSSGRYQLVPPSSRYPSGLFAFCEMDTTGGLTLVATRASNTLGSVWKTMETIPPGAPPSGVKKVTDLGPDGNSDAYLDIDWTLLGATEIVYDLGAPVSSMGKGVTRISFRELTVSEIGRGLEGLTRDHPPTVRPKCYVDSSTTPITNCLPMSAPPGDPMKSLGWAYAPTGTLCYFGYVDALGSLACDGTTVGKGRVFVK